MTESVYLVGSEAVERAASSIGSSAETMRSAAADVEGSLLRQRQFMGAWLDRLEEILDRHASSVAAGGEGPG